MSTFGLRAWRGSNGKRTKETVRLGNQEFEGEVVPFRGNVEHWNEYLLDDGSIIRMKIVATEMVRVDGQYDAEGNPLYMINSTNVTHVSSPDELKGGPQQ
jgi:hypothetical protein